MFLVLLTLQPIINVQGWKYEQGAKYGGTFVTAFPGSDPANLNPVMSTVSDIHQVVSNIFSTLVIVDVDWQLWPNLATNWTVSKDGLNYTFKLVQNATWHDGKPFTSADVVFTVNKAWKNSTVCPYSPSIFGALDRAEAIDNYTVVLYTKTPYAPLIHYLATTLYAAIIPKHIYDGTDILTNPANWKPIGTGPFKFLEWVHGDHITLVRNPSYFKQGLPYLNKIVHRIITDPIAKANAFEAGEIDGTQIPPELGIQKVKQYEKNPKYYVTPRRYSGLGVFFVLQFNVRENRSIIGGLSEKATKVRKALWHATNVSFIIENALLGMAEPATSMIPKGLWGYKNVAAQMPMPYNISLAKQMLDEAGYPVKADGWRFELYLPYVVQSVEQQEAEYLREAWAQVNVKVNIEGHDRGPKLTKWATGVFDVVFESPYHGPDASVTTGRFYLSTNIKPAAYTNCQGYNKSTVDQLFIQAQTTTDLVKRKEIYDQFQEIIWRDAPTIWIGERLAYDAFSVRFKGEPAVPFGSDDPLETVWWTDGSSYSPETTLVAIEDAGKKIDSYASQFYHVDAARAKLDQARAAYAQMEWATAASLANEAVGLVSPPYEIYGGVAAAAIAGVAIVIWQKRKAKPKF